MKRLAIIPARGGSKRIPKKNIKQFCGQPMISYPIDALKRSGLFDTIHVSTDCNEIVELVINLGLDVDFLRDPSLADDFTPIMPVLEWTLKQYKARKIFFDEVIMVMPCTPFIESSDFLDAYKLFTEANKESPVISVSNYPVPIEWAFDLKISDSSLTPLNPGMFKIRSQDLQKKYFDAGAFVLYSSEHILQTNPTNQDKNYIGFVLDKIKAIDIDDQDDWDFAELIMQSILRKK